MKLPSPPPGPVTEALRHAWTLKIERADFEAWLLSVPARHRARVRAWVAGCPPLGRRYFWERARYVMKRSTRERALEVVTGWLVRAALAKPPKCHFCGTRRSVAIDEELVTYCARCVSPGAVLVIDARRA